MLQMEKLLVMNNYSFCYYVLKRCLLHRHHKASTCAKGKGKNIRDKKYKFGFEQDRNKCRPVLLLMLLARGSSEPIAIVGEFQRHSKSRLESVPIV